MDLFLPPTTATPISSPVETNRTPLVGKRRASTYVLKMMMSNSRIKIKATIVIVLPTS